MDRIYLSFLWHMHQPFYKNLFTGEYLLPWVLLHGTKDYFDMAFILKEFPGLKQNFNLVPSLLRQLMDYEDLQAKDLQNGTQGSHGISKNLPFNELFQCKLGQHD